MDNIRHARQTSLSSFADKETCVYRFWACRLATGLITLVLLSRLTNIPHADDTASTTAWREQMAARERMSKDYAQLVKGEQFDQAEKIAERLIATDRQLLPVPPTEAGAPAAAERIERQVLDLVKWLADRDCQRDDWSAAIRRELELMKFLEQLHGKDDYRLADARRRGHYLALLRRLPMKDARQLVKADQLYDQGCKRCDYRDWRTGLPPAEKALEVYQRFLGEDSMQTADCVSLIAVLHCHQAAYELAEPLLRRACGIYKRILGENHPDYGESLTNLAELYQSRGDYARAEVAYQQARDIFKRIGRENHPSYAMILYCLGNVYFKQGDYTRAVALHREALEIRKRVLANDDVNLASSANSLANVYQSLGQYGRAEELYVEACDILRRAWGEEHPSYAGALDNLACVYVKLGNYAKAEPLFQKALAIMKKAFGENHPDYAVSLSRLAMLYQVRGDFTQAVPLYQQVLTIRRQALGTDHHLYAESLIDLAATYVDQHDDVQAEPLYRQAAATIRQHLEATSVIQSEQRQLLMLNSVRTCLDSYLSLVVRSNGYVEPAYQEVLAWKGSVLRRQRQMRTASDSVELRPVFTQLQRVASQLSQLAWAVPKPEQYRARQEQIAILSAEKDRLEGDLSTRSAAYRRARRQVTIKDLQTALPPDAVLLDFLEYWHCTPADKKAETQKSWEQRLVAFVITHDRPVQMVPLGATQRVGEAIDIWRQSFGATPLGESAAKYLRRRIWQPLESKLAGAQIVLISPDGTLGRLPFGALPGGKPGSYLLEEQTFDVVAVPQLIPELAEEKARSDSQKSLLLIGNVDYDAAPSGSGTESPMTPLANSAGIPARLMQFTPLPGTQGEIAAIEKLYHDHVGSAGITTLCSPRRASGRSWPRRRNIAACTWPRTGSLSPMRLACSACT